MSEFGLSLDALGEGVAGSLNPGGAIAISLDSSVHRYRHKVAQYLAVKF